MNQAGGFGQAYTPKLRLRPALTGIVVSDVFPARFQIRDGDRFVDGELGNVYNVEIPVEGAPPTIIQLMSLNAPKKGDEVTFKFPLETFLKPKYGIKDNVEIRRGGKIVKPLEGFPIDPPSSAKV